MTKITQQHKYLAKALGITEIEADKHIINDNSNPCDAIRSGRWINIFGDDPHSAPKGMCYFDHVRTCTDFCRSYTGKRRKSVSKFLKEIKELKK